MTSTNEPREIIEAAYETFEQAVLDAMQGNHNAESMNDVRGALMLAKDKVRELQGQAARIYQQLARQEAHDEMMRNKTPEELQALIDAAQRRQEAVTDEPIVVTPKTFNPGE